MRLPIPMRRSVLAVLSTLWLIAAPAPAAAPCRCPEDAHEAPATETPTGCHGEESSAPDDSRHTSDPCQASCGACATAAALPQRRSSLALSLAVHLEAAPPPAMRAGESRPPDHVPLTSL